MAAVRWIFRSLAGALPVTEGTSDPDIVISLMATPRGGCMRSKLYATLLCLALGLWAQAPTGQITGTVTDPSGAVIAGATITVTNTATNTRRETVTNKDGIFTLAALPPGVYNLQVDAKGF